MKASNKILLNEYKGKLKKIMNMHPSDSIRFNQFMELLTINCIRSYSKNQIAKISKFFDNPLKICRIQIPLSYLELECVQESEKKRYLQLQPYVSVIRVSSTVVNAYLYDSKQKKHNTVKCLQTLIRILRRNHGSERNWFKVLGGLTISVTIDPTTFKKSVAKVLCNTSHSNCASELVQYFLKDAKSQNIQWQSFMKIVNNAELLTEQSFEIQPKAFRSSFLSQSVISTDFLENKNTKQRRLTLLSAETRQTQSVHKKISPKRKKSNLSSLLQQYQQIAPPRYFSVSAKQCTLFEKRQLQKSVVQPVKITNNKFTHRKCKTQSNFFEVKEVQQKLRKETKSALQCPKEIKETVNVKINDLNIKITNNEAKKSMK